MSTAPVRIVGLGGTLRANSTTEKAIRCALAACEKRGAIIVQFAGPDLDFPNYSGGEPGSTAGTVRLVRELRTCHGVIVGSPGYHGAISGMMKNALDYIEDMSRDPQPYLHGRAIGCIGAAAGWQAASATLVNIRGIVHALRGWPTPLGVAINSAEPVFNEAGACLDPKVENQLDMLAAQVVEFAEMRRFYEALH